MPAIDIHKEHPDVGIESTDLFIYDSTAPGTGGLISIVHPKKLLERVTTMIKTEHLHATLLLTIKDNSAKVVLTQIDEPYAEDRKTFQLVDEFLTKEKASLNLLFSKWRIIALIDGEPLPEKPRRPS